MGRKPLTYSNFYPYHIYGRTNNKDWFAVDPEVCWRIFRNRINETIEKYSLDVHAFVLMINHYHFLLSTPTANISEAMNFMLTQISKDINKETGRINHVFGGRYKWSIIGNSTNYFNVYKYIMRNPVEAGAVTKVEHYQYSTIHEVVGHRKHINIVRNSNGFDSLIAEDRHELYYWLNLEFEESLRENIKKGLYRTKFDMRLKKSDNRT